MAVACYVGGGVVQSRRHVVACVGVYGVNAVRTEEQQPAGYSADKRLFQIHVMYVATAFLSCGVCVRVPTDRLHGTFQLRGEESRHCGDGSLANSSCLSLRSCHLQVATAAQLASLRYGCRKDSGLRQNVQQQWQTSLERQCGGHSGLCMDRIRKSKTERASARNLPQCTRPCLH